MLSNGNYTINENVVELSEIQLRNELAKTVHDSIVLQGTMLWVKSPLR